MDQIEEFARFREAIQAADRRATRRLFAVIAISFAAALVHIDLGAVAQNIGYAGAALLSAFLVFTIASLSRAKNRIAGDFGLICPSCGQRPKPDLAEQAYRSGRCPSCDKPLS